MSKIIQISTFPAAPGTERVPTLAERVASLRYSINLRFLNNRVPALVMTQCNIKAPRNSKWSKSGKKGATHPLLSMAYNIISCKRINQGNKKIKIPGFTRDVIWGSELRYVEKLLFTRVVESRFTQFWYGIY